MDSDAADGQHSAPKSSVTAWARPRLTAAETQGLRACFSSNLGGPVVRITGGNFRLLERLLTQIARILEVSNLREVAPVVVEVARETLVVGTA